MTKAQKYISAMLGICLMAVAVLVGVVRTAYASPQYVAPTVQTNAATSSPQLLIVGTAGTSTLQYDSYTPLSTTANYIASKVALALQLQGSSTATVFTLNTEYSNDGIDWYRNFVTGSTTSFASANSITWTNASTTLGGLTQPFLNKQMLLLTAPTRFVREVVSVTGANGSVWMQMIPVKETNKAI